MRTKDEFMKHQEAKEAQNVEDTYFLPEMPIKLERPIAFIDLETTGKNVTEDKIVEIAIVKLYPNEARQEMCWCACTRIA
jgi:DNA polymerase III epsilon subunit-like protein